MMDIVQNGHTIHLIVNADDLTAEDIVLMKAHVKAFKAVRKEGLTSGDIAAAYQTIVNAESSWCRSQGFRNDKSLMMALARLMDNLARSEARHATA